MHLATGSSLFAALETLGTGRERRELAQDLVATDPEWAEAWFQLARSQFEAGEAEAARTSLKRALDPCQDADRDTRRRYPISAHRLLRDVDPAASLSCLIQIMLEAGDSEPFRREVQHWPQRASPEILDRALSSLELTQEREREVRAVHSRAEAGRQREPVLETLELHLSQLVERCRARGARPVLLTYPFWHEEHRGAMARVAQATGAELVDLNPAFTRELAPRRCEERFAPNGHCSDEGYRIMAGVVAEHDQAPESRAAAAGAAQDRR